MKLNWGSAIAIFYTLFAFIMISMVIKAMGNKPHLVLDDYYQLDLAYETHRQKKENNANLDKPLKINLKEGQKGLTIFFPENLNNIEGDVHLFRPSNEFLDQKFEIKLDTNNQMIIEFDKPLTPGLWKVKIDWADKIDAYYSEIAIAV